MDHEDSRAERRRNQEELWRDTNIDARQQLNTNEARQIYRKRYLHAIDLYDAVYALVILSRETDSYISLLSGQSYELILKVSEYLGFSQQNQSQSWINSILFPSCIHPCTQTSKFRVFVRKRPLLSYEAENCEYCVVKARKDRKTIICHEGKLSKTSRQLQMKHVQYRFDNVLEEDIDNNRVCEATVKPLLQHVRNTASATLLFYGQTGTGKTYTLIAALKYLAKHITEKVSVSFYELHGRSKCYDLLQNRIEIKLLNDATGKVQAVGAKQIELKTPSENSLMQILNSGIQLRSSCSTERNPVSSRSHAICRFHFSRHALTLVDLAGSERNYDTRNMNAQDHRESAEINKSLLALKSCFQAYHSLSRGKSFMSKKIEKPLFQRWNQNDATTKTKHIANITTPVRLDFRASILTRSLCECFLDKSHMTYIVAAVSPSAADINHTLDSLRHVGLMMKTSPLQNTLITETSLSQRTWKLLEKPVHEWSCKEVREYLNTEDNGRFAHIVLPPNLDGKGLLRLGARSLGSLFEGVQRHARAEMEGNAWTVGVDTENTSDDIGRRLFDSLRAAQTKAMSARLGLRA
mmetsp:Transcript_18953/g.24117  ORF Transcript_18953/g.24117 Transcript_18953/m.24117 type:complete len:580 (-) Transcript_18953:815-2554(-)|eukprot:CAMPEP_0204825766 /NCGR_PEP_ID=MMETSP1346-20131115/3577_1 /ASSEMBLY_ACC=CAM_ASM_000771 /TAXON_ID=215587 /ORGANISM="Aplanochytrium stocchinoi, Strain GSBS06" /LENGTH=579 /DNA_ID=CAMNT_0051953499 /DNA_START=211 /DNA_END=1950 /DNA_ORIENTATION=+